MARNYRPVNDGRLAAIAQRQRETFGTTVKCPDCGAGVGKFCLRDGVKVYNGPADRVIHVARVTLANQ